MHLIVGSKNPNKVEAVRELTAEYEIWRGAEVTGVAAASGVADQPMTLQETIEGAINRARAAYASAAADDAPAGPPPHQIKNSTNIIGIGLESGLVPAPHTKSGYFDICVCAIFDGTATHLGLSNGFEYPPRLIAHLLEHGGEIDTAVKGVGFDMRDRVGYAEGMIGLLTHGRVPRKEMSKQSVRMALIHLENAEWY